MVEPGLRWTVCHVLDGSVEGRFPTVLKSSLPNLSSPACAVLWHNNILWPEGLFPSRTPDTKVYCSLHRLQDQWTVRTLTIAEKLRLYQLPLSMDAALTPLFSNGWLLFADVPSPKVYTSILRQLWGETARGGTFVSDLTDDSESHSLAISSREDAVKEEKEEKEVMSIEAEDREAREEMCVETDGSGAKVSDAKEEEIRSLARWWSTVTKQKFGVCDTPNVIDDLVPPMEGTDLSMMTAETPVTALPPPPISYHFEFDLDFAGGNEGVLDDDTIPDDDTAPSDASVKTRWMRGW